MSRIVTVILIYEYHRHIPIDQVFLMFCSVLQVPSKFRRQFSRHSSLSYIQGKEGRRYNTFSDLCSLRYMTYPCLISNDVTWAMASTPVTHSVCVTTLLPTFSPP
jgi:hypothetical protein